MIPHETDTLTTEQVNPRSINLDELSTLEIIQYMNEEDYGVPLAVSRCLNEIAQAVDCISNRLAHGGRLFYVGAGTSGRLGALDAYECPPTFGTEPEVVQALLAGGEKTRDQAGEEAEDDQEQGAADLLDRGLTTLDVVVGIAASGRTPYVIGALQFAGKLQAATIAISCNKDSKISKIADIAIEVIVGAEVLAGSTRLKSGTAQKMVLNMLSTASMIKQGKVFRNWMVDMQASNEKLRARSSRIVQQATGADEANVMKALGQSGHNVKVSIIMLLANVDHEKAADLLIQADGWVSEALQLTNGSR